MYVPILWGSMQQVVGAGHGASSARAAPGDMIGVGRLLRRMASSSRAEASRNLNRLAKEKSPYLLQHASNPVDW